MAMRMLGFSGERRIQRPFGVTVVAVMTLLSSGALFLLYFVLTFLLVGYGEGISFDWGYIVQQYPIIPVSLMFTVFAFFLSIAMLTLASKYVWYASMLFWLMELPFFLWWAYGIWMSVGVTTHGEPWQLQYDWQYQEIFATLIPFVYAVGCMIYYQTARVKEYFGVRIHALSATRALWHVSFS